MNEVENRFITQYMMGRTAFDSAFDGSLSSSERAENLSRAVYYFDEALNGVPDEESEMECRRLLGAALFTLHFRNPADIGQSGLSSFPGLFRAIAEQEKALELDARTRKKFFGDRSIAAEVLQRLDTLWMYESFHISKRSGALNAAKYLQDKLRLLEYLGGVNLPGTCFALYLHYGDKELGSSEFYFLEALQWLRSVAQGETYEDVSTGLFHSAALQYKKQAQDRLTLLGA